MSEEGPKKFLCYSTYIYLNFFIAYIGSGKSGWSWIDLELGTVSSDVTDSESMVESFSCWATLEVLACGVTLEFLACGATLEVLAIGVVHVLLAFDLVSSLTRFPSFGFASWTSQICNSLIVNFRTGS